MRRFRRGSLISSERGGNAHFYCKLDDEAPSYPPSLGSGLLFLGSGLQCLGSGLLFLGSGLQCLGSGLLCLGSGLQCLDSGLLCLGSGLLCLCCILASDASQMKRPIFFGPCPLFHPLVPSQCPLRFSSGGPCPLVQFTRRRWKNVMPISIFA